MRLGVGLVGTASATAPQRVCHRRHRKRIFNGNAVVVVVTSSPTISWLACSRANRLRVDHRRTVSAALGSRERRVVAFRVAVGFWELVVVPHWVPSFPTVHFCVHWAYGWAGNLACSRFPDPVTQAEERRLQPVTSFCLYLFFIRLRVTQMGNIYKPRQLVC